MQFIENQDIRKYLTSLLYVRFVCVGANVLLNHCLHFCFHFLFIIFFAAVPVRLIVCAVFVSIPFCSSRFPFFLFSFKGTVKLTARLAVRGAGQKQAEQTGAASQRLQRRPVSPKGSLCFSSSSILGPRKRHRPRMCLCFTPSASSQSML